MLLVTAACLKTFRTLTHPRLLKYIFLSLLMNAALLAALVGAIYWLLDATTLLGWLDRLVDWGLTSLAAFIAYFIFPVTLPLVVSLFDNGIASATEQAEYPHVPTPQPPFWPTIGQDIAFVAKAVGLNMLALPLYLMPLVGIGLYYLLNGYLLGKEFFRVVAGRHMTPADAQTHWIKYRVSIIGGGVGVAFCATVPIANLIVPVGAVVMMTHLLHMSAPTYKPTAAPEQPKISQQL